MTTIDSPISIDASTSYLIVCTACPHWFAFQFDYDAAEGSAVRHEGNVHPDSTAWRDRAAVRARVKRHRAKTSPAM